MSMKRDYQSIKNDNNNVINNEEISKTKSLLWKSLTDTLSSSNESSKEENDLKKRLDAAFNQKVSTSILLIGPPGCGKRKLVDKVLTSYNPYNNEGDDNKVIMLSLQNAASGTNLTEASHILFIEPINSTVEERKAIEGQAIGRACRVGQKNKVTVMRILIEDTIEEKIYRSTYNKDIVIDFKDDDAIMKEINPEKNKDKPVKNIVV
jgi:hypothetical protein